MTPEAERLLVTLTEVAPQAAKAIRRAWDRPRAKAVFTQLLTIESELGAWGELPAEAFVHVMRLEEVYDAEQRARQPQPVLPPADAGEKREETRLSLLDDHEASDFTR